MHKREELPLGTQEMSMADVLIVMTQRSYGCFGVLDGEGRLSGIITDGDLRRHMSPELLKLEAGAIMTPLPKTIRMDALASEALEQINALKITSLFVIDDDTRPVGLVHIHDLLRIGLI
jgi:arabinose-5-phosphate isomerase